MAVSMEDVRRVPDPEEPDYEAAAHWVRGCAAHGDLGHWRRSLLASKATYAASLLEDGAGQEIVRIAAESTDPVVRVAAAAAARNLPVPSARDILAELATDDDPGIRKVARDSVPDDSAE